MSFMKESILVGLADLGMISVESDCVIAFTYTSTMQLFVLISNTFPPN